MRHATTRTIEFDQIRQSYRLTTAEILYHLPDHPSVLQSFIWQQLDLAPRYPALHRFLDFWTRQIDGKLHSVRLASADVIGAPAWRNAKHLRLLN